MQKVCVICGKPFMQRGSRQITCSEECSRERRQQMRKQKEEAAKDRAEREAEARVLLRLQRVNLDSMIRSQELRDEGIMFAGSANKDMVYAICEDEIGIVTKENGHLRLSKYEAAKMIRELQRIIANMEGTWRHV